MIKNYKLAFISLLVSCSLSNAMEKKLVFPPDTTKVAIVLKNPRSLPSNIDSGDKESLKKYSKVPIEEQFELNNKIIEIIGFPQYIQSYSEFDGRRRRGTSGDNRQGYLMALITSKQRCKLLEIEEISKVDYFYYLNHKILNERRLEGDTTLDGIFYQETNPLGSIVWQKQKDKK